MKTTVDFLNEALVKLGDVTAYRMSKITGISQPAFSRYKGGDRIIDDYAATKIAEILEIDPMIIISAANAEREKNAEKKTFWAKKYAELGGIAASLFLVVSLSFVSEDAQAQPQASNGGDINVYPVI